MKVIPANISTDMDNLVKVARNAFSNTPDASLDDWFSFDEMKTHIEQDKGVCMKALSDDGKIIGMTYAQQESPINGPEGEEKWVILIAAVDPDSKWKGVGSELLHGIEDVARIKLATKMFVFTNKEDTDVISFYKKNGYEDAGWIRDYQYGKGNSAIFLIKYL